MGAVEATRTRWIMAGLAMLMAMTRFHHEGTAFALPDASLAVFFLLGWYSRSPAVFVGFLLGAFAIDYFAIVHGGVSDYCVTPAYGFLVPTYATMWGAGRWSQWSRRPAEALPLLKIAVALPVAVTLAFIISNGSFFLFSGRLSEAGWVGYSLGVARDYPAYLFAALMYTGLLLFLDALARMIPSLESRWAKSK